MTPPPETDELGIYECSQGRALYVIAYGAVACGGAIMGLIAGLLIGGVI